MQGILINAGLDETEAKVYLALLELGPSTVSGITHKAGVTRTLGYHVLEKLCWHGLADEVSSKNKKKIYTARHPHSLLQHVKNKKKQWERNLSLVEEHLPDLVSLYKIADKPVIRFCEGVEGVKEIYSETLEAKTEILSFCDIEGFCAPEFKNGTREYNRERTRRSIFERMLMLDTQFGHEWMEDYQGSLKYNNFKWIRSKDLPGIQDLGGEVNIFDENKIVILLLKPPHRMGIYIESKILANLLRTMFELAWKSGILARTKRRVIKKTRKIS